MEHIDPIIRWLHVAAGILVLVTMVLPMVTKKGGRVHRRAGWIFVISMAIVCVSSAWMCIVALAGLQGVSVTGRGVMGREFGAFLLVVTLLSGQSIFSGIRVLRHKNRTAPVGNLLDLGPPAILGLSSIGLGIWGIAEGSVLLIAFAVLGISIGVRDIRALRRVPTDKRHWWYAHMTGMFNGSVAALTAFLVINSENLPDSIRSAVPEWVFWLAPTVVMTPILIAMRRHYERKFARD